MTSLCININNAQNIGAYRTMVNSDWSETFDQMSTILDSVNCELLAILLCIYKCLSECMVTVKYHTFCLAAVEINES